MDEESLSAAVQTYKAQLEQVRQTLSADVDPSQKADLLQLQGDLQQLIELTESSLLSVQKSNLLSTLDGPSSSCSQHDDEYEAFRRAVGELSKESEATGAVDSHSSCSVGSEEEEEDGTSGMKVRAPYYSTWGTLEYHNAMIVGSEQTEDGSPGVRVLYLYPTHKALKPCPYFLDGKCRFNESCRFSHGQVVAVSELQAFEEPDISSLGIDKACLARHSDGIWYPGRIIDIDSSFYTVKFDSALLKEAVLEADGIMPPLRENDSSSEEDDEDGTEDLAYAQVLMDNEVGGAGPCSSEFAGWEAHTRGIGSKLLARMGYEFGKGLGRNSEGRIEPVQAVVLPKGKSLDQCIEIQQRKHKGGKRPPKNRKKPAPKLAGAAGRGNTNRRNVFDFLNEKLEGKSPNVQETKTNLERKGKEVYNASQSSKRALNIEVAKTMEKIQQKQREIAHITESLARNVGRDSVIITQLEKRLSDARCQLAALQQEERSLQREQKKANTHKKMTEF